MRKCFSTLLVVMLLSVFSLMPVSQLAFASEVTATKYEAENAIVNQAEKKYLDGVGSYAVGGSGTGFVGGIDYDTSCVTFTVSVTTAGTYEFFLKYATGSDNATLIVENYDSQSVTLNCSSKKGWGAFNTTPTASASIQLKAGEQTVIVKKGNQYVEISNKIGDFIAGSDASGNYVPELTDGGYVKCR